MEPVNDPAKAFLCGALFFDYNLINFDKCRMAEYVSASNIPMQ